VVEADGEVGAAELDGGDGGAPAPVAVCSETAVPLEAEHAVTAAATAMPTRAARATAANLCP
jgi:hypothetical protein